MSETFDAIVIGSGAGGSMAARAFAKKGLRVLVLEKGENHYRSLESGSLDTTYSNDELKLGTRNLITPDPLLEPRSFRTSAERVRDHVGDVNGLPSTVGGGLNHADWKARRLRPADFRLKELLGEVDGASVVDWPISYDELEPFYDAAERIVGVQGPAEIPAPFGPWRSRPYPMPPGVPQYVGRVLSNAARLLGLHPFEAPTGITSRPYRDRPPCNDCGFDGGFGCPIGAKGTPAVTALRDALLLRDASNLPLVTLRASSMAVRLVTAEVAGERRVTAVEYLDANGATPVLRTAEADVFVLAASPIESVRLALQSDLDRSGWGNTSGLLGKNLMFHYQTLAIGVFAERLHPYRGRTITHMLDDFAGPAELADYATWPFPRGGTLELGGTQNVIDEGKNYQRGPQHRTLMRVSPLRNRLGALTMQGEDLPQEGNFVDLDPELTDVWGLRVPRVTYASHRFELEAAAFWLPQILGLLDAAGAVFAAPLGSDAPKGTLPAELEGALGEIGALNVVPSSRHIMGVFRMGDDPAKSVTDRNGKFHDFENLYSGDGAVFPTSGGMNPSLTVMALSYRMACAAVGDGADPVTVLHDIDPDL